MKKITPEAWFELLLKKFKSQAELSTLKIWTADTSKHTNYLRVESILTGRGHLATVSVKQWGKEGGLFQRKYEMVQAWRTLSFWFDENGIRLHQYHRTWAHGEEGAPYGDHHSAAVATTPDNWMREFEDYEFDMHEHRGPKVAYDTGILTTK